MKALLLLTFSIIGPFLIAQSFTEKSQTFEGVADGEIAFADVDGDGDQDVLLSGRNISEVLIAKLYTNDGTGNFTEKPGTPFEGIEGSSIAFSDVDGDGDKDVLISGRNSSTEAITKLYTNDGMGSFTEATGTPFQSVFYGSITFSDVDNDGDEDVLLTGQSNSEENITKLYTNDGMGGFTAVTGAPFEGVFRGSVAFSDVDGDGDEDVLITGLDNLFNISVNLYLNDGMGSFTEATSTTFSGVADGSVAFADVDGDGDDDVLITGDAGPFTIIAELYTNDGMGNFTEVADTHFDNGISSSAAFSDVDGDGDEDVLIAGLNASFERVTKLYTNDGMGSFTEVTGTPFEGVSLNSIAFADVDGDSDEDVLLTGSNSSNELIAKLYTNDLMTTSVSKMPTFLRSNILVYPNPVRFNQLTIHYFSKKEGDATVQVFDLNGRLLLQHRELVSIGKQIFLLDVSALPKGSYILQIKEAGGVGVGRFLIQ